MSREKISNRTRLAIVFLAMTIAVSANSAYATANYLQFYPALAQLEVNITSFQITNQTNQSLQGTVTFTIDNPTRYIGIGLTGMESILTIHAPNGTSILLGGLPIPSLGKPLNPGEKVNVPIPFIATPDAAALSAQIRRSGGQTDYIFTIQLSLSTFLESQWFVKASYLCDSTASPTSCAQSAVSFTPTINFGSGGGGGA